LRIVRPLELGRSTSNLLGCCYRPSPFFGRWEPHSSVLGSCRDHQGFSAASAECVHDGRSGSAGRERQKRMLQRGSRVMNPFAMRRRLPHPITLGLDHQRYPKSSNDLPRPSFLTLFSIFTVASAAATKKQLSTKHHSRFIRLGLKRRHLLFQGLVQFIFRLARIKQARQNRVTGLGRSRQMIWCSWREARARTSSHVQW
jgi:hypothetical protein